jgi:hypothetical protein
MTDTPLVPVRLVSENKDATKIETAVVAVEETERRRRKPWQRGSIIKRGGGFTIV